MSPASLLQHALRTARLDGTGRRAQPLLGAVVAATVLAVVGSVAANAALVALATRTFPTTRHYGHFHFADYATLTAIGVLAAGASWPVVARVSWAPRWPYLRLAVVVTVVLWVPDLWLLSRGQPLDAVGVLMTMHLVVAVLTYNIVVRVAPARPLGRPGPETAGAPSGTLRNRRGPEPTRPARRGGPWSPGWPPPWPPWSAWSFSWASGHWSWCLSVDRPVGCPPVAGRSTWPMPPSDCRWPWGRRCSSSRCAPHPRLSRVSGWIGLVGVALAGAGGIAATAHPLRLMGGGLMFVGSMVAGFGYLTPLFEAASTASS